MAENMQKIMNPNLAVDQPGFPTAPDGWRVEEAEELIRAEGLEPDADYWEAIRALQYYHAAHARINVRELHDALDEKFHAQGGIKYLYELFPGGPLAQGSRIAGFEPPAGAADPAFGSLQ